MVEGSLWVYGGQTDLGDLYRGNLTLRQVWIRIQALPPEAPLWFALSQEREQAEQKQQALDIDAALAPFQRKG